MKRLRIYLKTLTSKRNVIELHDLEIKPNIQVGSKLPFNEMAEKQLITQIW